MPLNDQKLRKGDLVSIRARVRWDFDPAEKERFVFLETPGGHQFGAKPEEIESVVYRRFDKGERVTNAVRKTTGVVHSSSDDGAFLWIETEAGFTTIPAAGTELNPADPDFAEVGE